MAELQLRKWQTEAVQRSNLPTNGIFLEALGGKGKTICALAIAKHKKAKKIIITNNRLSILSGWIDAIKLMDFDKDVEIIVRTDRYLQDLVSKGSKLTCGVLIIDEWQNMSSDKQTSLYRKIKRKYTIGLSATPIRKKGQNFYPLEKTIFGWATPNRKFDWQKAHGKMVYDPFSYSKEKWQDFKDYETYISGLPNFFRWEEIEEIEKSVENNGYDIKFYRNTVEVGNPTLLKIFRQLNIVNVNGKCAMAKQSFGRKTFERYLMQTGVEVDFPKLKAVNQDTPLLLKIDGLIERAPHGMLIVSKSKQVVNVIRERNPNIGIWTGDVQDGLDKQVVVATNQVLGVGVDGLQHKFKTIVVLDPVDESSGEYDDYRQLLWRVTGSRQQHDVNVIEFYYKEN
ncbi:DEAD/DEAH box helicase family protein [Streptococcus anginosus]|uniref:DEAD/DEAH box helicase family protein n=1 Tax=Streptococcus TaxID=1301 RepID=UPI0008A9CFB7|nr:MULTISPECIES: DEAD/DEAH box helicase family protein [Streptococcus]MCW0990385.1 DEAD/DEAH box helicase family protein [Streptococcus anginosus]MCW1008077.1 DEAD/DEAH box helicase family protein [Streptococcus anginosus]MCW1091240.1 DEAD/DEAH box helicase family protein [Streptococcus anginosus]MDU1591393.1 DEAD/DEAH box helicase family protein [Streptococcus anginosus]MDU1638257.1 DEAD/DEAH box helicase family protein [Streptococcus anginosus]